MVYITHSAAISQMLSDSSKFISELIAKAQEQNLGGFDIDYEPQVTFLYSLNKIVYLLNT